MKFVRRTCFAEPKGLQIKSPQPPPPPPAAPWLLGRPRLRKDWDNVDASGPTSGRISTQETLWGVFVAMAIGSMRDKVFENYDIKSYILRFFAFWRVVEASMSMAGHENYKINILSNKSRRLIPAVSFPWSKRPNLLSKPLGFPNRALITPPSNHSSP